MLYIERFYAVAVADWMVGFVSENIDRLSAVLKKVFGDKDDDDDDEDEGEGDKGGDGNDSEDEKDYKKYDSEGSDIIISEEEYEP